jgi:hypothetical protein
MASRKKVACPDCGGTKCSKSARCRPCSGVRRRTRICPQCGGFKARGPRAELCRTCFDAARRTAAIHNGVLRAFDAERFAKLLARPDVDWPTALLADRAGVHPDTIRGWLRGTKPRIVEWQRVAAVLALGDGRPERAATDHRGGHGPDSPVAPAPNRPLRPDAGCRPGLSRLRTHLRAADAPPRRSWRRGASVTGRCGIAHDARR